MSRSSPDAEKGNRYSSTGEPHGQRQEGLRVLIWGQMNKAEGLDIGCRMRCSKE